jgi:antitoxin component YwqK of YwqJK toxin-antitoxin module
MQQQNTIRALTFLCLTFMCLFMFGFTAPKEEVRMTYFPNGYIKTSTQYEHGKKNGVFKQFFENGKLQLLRTYKDDVLDGKSIEYYPNGKLKEEVAYQQGKALHLRLYDEQGKLILSKY